MDETMTTSHMAQAEHDPVAYTPEFRRQCQLRRDEFSRYVAAVCGGVFAHNGSNELVIEYALELIHAVDAAVAAGRIDAK